MKSVHHQKRNLDGVCAGVQFLLRLQPPPVYSAAGHYIHHWSCAPSVCRALSVRRLDQNQAGNGGVPSRGQPQDTAGNSKSNCSPQFLDRGVRSRMISDHLTSSNTLSITTSYDPIRWIIISVSWYKSRWYISATNTQQSEKINFPPELIAKKKCADVQKMKAAHTTKNTSNQWWQIVACYIERSLNIES